MFYLNFILAVLANSDEIVIVNSNSSRGKLRINSNENKFGYVCFYIKFYFHKREIKIQKYS